MELSTHEFIEARPLDERTIRAYELSTHTSLEEDQAFDWGEWFGEYRYAEEGD